MEEFFFFFFVYNKIWIFARNNETVGEKRNKYELNKENIREFIKNLLYV